MEKYKISKERIIELIMTKGNMSRSERDFYRPLSRED
jgi:hypothetical protein